MTEVSSTSENSGAPTATSKESGLVQISQGALSGLIGDAKREAAERERAKMASEYEAKMQKLREDAKADAEAAAERKVHEMKQKDIEEQKQKQLNEAGQAIKDKLQPAFKQGEQHFEDWKETVQSYNWKKSEYAEILPLLAQDEIDNPADVLHHITKEGHIERLASRSPAYIMGKLKEISASLKETPKTPVIDAPPEPIKPLKPSHTKTKGDGDYTIDDFRKASWLRN